MSKITRSRMALQIEHAAIVAHGAHPEYRLEFVGDVADNATGIYQGSVVSIDTTSKKFVLGCGAGTNQNYPIPMISMKNVIDPDVTTGMAADSTGYNGTYSAIGGKITAIPVTGGYEIETTEFEVEASGSAVVYNPGDALTVGATTLNGKVVKATAAVYANTTPIIGFVSSGVGTDNTLGKKVLGFFTCFFPAKRAE